MCKISELEKHLSQSQDWKATGVVGPQRMSRGQSWWASLTQHCTSEGTLFTLYYVFCSMCTKVALVGATHLRAERKNIRTSNLVSYYITVFPWFLSSSLFLKKRKEKKKNVFVFVLYIIRKLHDCLFIMAWQF